MVNNSGEIPVQPTIQELRQQMADYGRPDLRIAVGQLIDTLGPYAALWWLLCYLIRHGYPGWVLLLPIIGAALFLVRIFIIFHDCSHGSFFDSDRANTVLGYIAGGLTFTPFEYWRWNHDGHHRTYADLDRRGVGDIWTLTVDEYRAMPKTKQFAYRFARNPLVFLIVGPGFIFLVTQRLLHEWQGKEERRSVLITNLMMVGILAIAKLTIGLRTYLMIQIPVLLLAGAMGIWLFYVQHQFEGVYWSRHANWDPLTAAMRGSSYYKLPRVLRWFTANIGLHHVHHIMTRIPNYRLQRCYQEIPALQTAPVLTIARSLKSLRLNLWDEQRQELVSFRSLEPRGKTNSAAVGP